MPSNAALKRYGERTSSTSAPRTAQTGNEGRVGRHSRAIRTYYPCDTFSSALCETFLGCYILLAPYCATNMTASNILLFVPSPYFSWASCSLVTFPLALLNLARGLVCAGSILSGSATTIVTGFTGRSCLSARIRWSHEYIRAHTRGFDGGYRIASDPLPCTDSLTSHPSPPFLLVCPPAFLYGVIR